MLTLEQWQHVQDKLTHVADIVWNESGGDFDSSPTTRYEAVLQTLGSFLSCLASDIGENHETLKDTVSGLLAGLRDDMARDYAVNIRPQGLPKRAFEVEVVAYQPVTTVVTVEATSPAEARAIAERDVAGDIGSHDWTEQDWDSDDVDNAQVTSECCCHGTNHDGPCCTGWFKNIEIGRVERCDECDVFASDDDAAKAAGRR
jgi:hypothetical protein